MMRLRVAALLFLTCVICATESAKLLRKRNAEPLSPVIFIPGDGGSQVEAKLNKKEVVHYICQKKTKDFYNIWLNLELLLPGVIDCWIDNVRLVYDNVTRTTSNAPGVEIRIPGWGNSEPVEWLDPSHARSGAYFVDIGNALVQIGYKRNVSIKGAPFDFRKAPNENKQWFIDMKVLVEETYKANNKTPITFIAHSMGAPMSLLFLQGQSAEWKDQYIARLISLAGAWAGSTKAVKVFAIGDDLGSFALKASTMRAEQITSPSLAWLLPSPIFWKGHEVLVETQSRTYTMDQLEEFFNDLQYPIGWEMRKDTVNYTKNFSPPGVEVHCLYGTNIETVERLQYPKEGLDDTPVLKNGDGDGTVNLRSLEACIFWRRLQKQKIKTLNLPSVDHMGILNNEQTIKYIVGVLAG